MAKSEKDHQGRDNQLVFWVLAFRGGLAIVLGLTLLVIPEKTFKMLGNFMGIFWLMAGIVSIRSESIKDRDRLSLATGIVGVLTGLIVITRNFMNQWLGDVLVLNLLGIVISLTGILKLINGFKIGKQAQPGQIKPSIILGVFEFILGLLLLLGPTQEMKLIYMIGIGWALLGGILLLGDAFRQRRAMADK